MRDEGVSATTQSKVGAHDKHTCLIVAGARVVGSIVNSAGQVGVLPTSVTFSTAPDS